MALIALPLFGFIFVILALGWMLFAKATLQNAAREGVRYAVTNHSIPDIQAVVQNHALGFLAGNSGLAKISVQYFTPGMQATASNQGGNLVDISVSGVTVDPFGLRSFGLSIVTLSAESSDVMEGSPAPVGR